MSRKERKRNRSHPEIPKRKPQNQKREKEKTHRIEALGSPAKSAVASWPRRPARSRCAPFQGHLRRTTRAMEELASATAERKSLSGAKCVPPVVVRRGGAETERRKWGEARRAATVAVAGSTPAGAVGHPPASRRHPCGNSASSGGCHAREEKVRRGVHHPPPPPRLAPAITGGAPAAGLVGLLQPPPARDRRGTGVKWGLGFRQPVRAGFDRAEGAAQPSDQIRRPGACGERQRAHGRATGHTGWAGTVSGG
jgi:hypothetical protein